MSFPRWLVVLPLSFFALPAVAQSGEVAAELARAAPLASRYCVQRTNVFVGQASRDAFLLDCLRYRARYPVRDWRYPEKGGETAVDTRPEPIRSREFPPLGSNDMLSPADRYFPKIGEPMRVEGRGAAEISACRGESATLAAARDKTIREGRGVMDYRMRVMQMSPSQLAAEQARLDQILEARPDYSRALRPYDGDDEYRDLTQRQRYFLRFAREIANGERVYRGMNDDLWPVIQRNVARYRSADNELRSAMERCFVRRDSAAKAETADSGDWMTGTFDNGGGNVFTLNHGSGSYVYANGTMAADRIDGNVVEGLWTQSSSGQQCKDGGYHGRFRITFTEDGFSGLFGYCDEPPGAPGGFQGTRRRK